MARSPWEQAPAGSNEAKHGRVIRSVTLPVDELSQPSGTGEDADGSKRGAHGHFGPGNTISKDKRIKAGPRGALAKLEAQGDEHWQASVRWGRRYGAHRRSELSKAHGSVSAGVGTIIESAADLMADARYWRARAIAEGSAEYSKLSASLMAQARGCERDAWELCARENAVKGSKRNGAPLGFVEADE